MFLGEIFGPDLLIVVIVVAVLVFGGSAIPKLARNLGSAKTEFEQVDVLEALVALVGALGVEVLKRYAGGVVGDPAVDRVDALEPVRGADVARGVTHHEVRGLDERDSHLAREEGVPGAEIRLTLDRDLQDFATRRFGEETVKTKAFVMVPRQVEQIEVGLVQITGTPVSLPDDPYDVALMLEEA